MWYCLTTNPVYVSCNNKHLINNNICIGQLTLRTYWSSVVTTDCPLEPQSLLGPDILAQTTYHLLAWSWIGSSNKIGYLCLQNKVLNKIEQYTKLGI